MKKEWLSPLQRTIYEKGEEAQREIADNLAFLVKDLTTELEILRGELEEARKGRSFWRRIANLYIKATC